jgi:hypothetical protein
MGRTLSLRILLEVVLVEAIGIDAPLLVWIYLIIYFAIDSVVFASIAVAATRQQAREAGVPKRFGEFGMDLEPIQVASPRPCVRTPHLAPHGPCRPGKRPVGTAWARPSRMEGVLVTP